MGRLHNRNREVSGPCRGRSPGRWRHAVPEHILEADGANAHAEEGRFHDNPCDGWNSARVAASSGTSPFLRGFSQSRACIPV